MSAIDALPSVPTSALPADVRNASPADQKAYRAALGFEHVLLQTVMSDLTKSTGMDGSPYSGQIQDAMTDALTDGGGLGIGEQLYHALRPAVAKP